MWIRNRFNLSIDSERTCELKRRVERHYDGIPRCAVSPLHIHGVCRARTVMCASNVAHVIYMCASHSSYYYVLIKSMLFNAGVHTLHTGYKLGVTRNHRFDSVENRTLLTCRIVKNNIAYIILQVN